MSETHISDAICGRITDQLPGYTVIWENRDSIPARPYIALEVVRLAPRDRTVSATKTEFAGFLQASVVAELDQFANPSLEMAEEIAGLFPTGQSIPAGDVTITIMKPPHIQQGYRDGPDWRTPVKIDYEAS
jgi:hypothetical protein